MKTCPQCGFHHTDLDERCIRCNAYLNPLGNRLSGNAVPHAEDAAPREQFDFTGAEIPHWRPRLPGLLAAWARRRFYFLGRALTSELPRHVHHRNVWTAGALALIPGAGQLYNHQPKKALYFFVLLLFWLTLVVLTFRHPLANWVLYAYALVSAWAFHDGIMTAKRINRDYLTWQHTIAFYSAWVFYLCLVYMAFQYAGHQHFIFQLRTARDAKLTPILNKGESFCVDCLTLRLRPPRVGEMVAFKPNDIQVRMYHFDAIDNTLKGDECFSRIIGGPGDTLERRAGGPVLRNGQPLPAGALLSGLTYPWDFKLTASEDQYLILITCHAFFKSKFIAGTSRVEVTNWEQACVIPRKAIRGRVMCVYDPPPARRWVRASAGMEGVAP